MSNTPCPLLAPGFCDKVNSNVSVRQCLEYCESGKHAAYWKKEIARRRDEVAKERAERINQGGNINKQRAELVELAKEMELPNPLQQAINLGRHLKEIWEYRKRTGRKYVSDEWQQQRLAICRACPKLRIKRGKEFCGLCGCGVERGVFVWKSKTRYEAMACSLGFWDEVDRVNGKIT